MQESKSPEFCPETQNESENQLPPPLENTVEQIVQEHKIVVAAISARFRKRLREICDYDKKSEEFLALPLEKKIELIKGKMEEVKQVRLQAKMDVEASLEQFNENLDRHMAAELERLQAKKEVLARKRELFKKSMEEHESNLKLSQARWDKHKKKIDEVLLKKQKLEQKLAQDELAIQCLRLKRKYVKLSGRRTRV
jgi:hypothetical protein